MAFSLLNLTLYALNLWQLPDASSAHRQASPQDIDRQPQPHSEPIAGVPADGIVRAGRSAIDESSFMREPLPVTKVPGVTTTKLSSFILIIF